jgi:hypothetical protein
MSYYIKPRLTETKITNLITDKLERRKQKIIIENQNIEQEIIQTKILNESIQKKIYNYILDFVKKNYMLFCIILLMLILLYLRYNQTKKKKEKLKELLESEMIN